MRDTVGSALWVRRWVRSMRKLVARLPKVRSSLPPIPKLSKKNFSVKEEV